MTGIFILALAYVISHFYRAFLAVLSPVLSSDLGMTPADLSNALGAWFAAFALSQFLVGSLLDRVGPKWTSAGLFAVFGAGGGVLFAQAQSPTLVMIAMVALGIGCSPILMASVYIFKRAFSPSRFAMLTSLNIAVGMAGNILGTTPLVSAMDAVGWRGVLYGLSGVTILLSVFIVLVVKDPPKAPQAGQGSYLDVIRIRSLWVILPLIFFNYAVAGGLRGIWAGPYLNLVHGLDAAAIGTATFYMALAMVVGSIAYGPMDQALKTRKWVVVGGSLGVAVTIWYWTLNPGMAAGRATVALVCIGLFAMSYGVLMAHASANIPDHLTGRGVTLINFFNMGGVGVMQWVTAGVYKSTQSQSDPLAGFQTVLMTYAVLFTAALAVYLLSKDAPPQAKG
ncbi:MAG: MFS transporter [Pseudomonadota bacterium]